MQLLDRLFNRKSEEKSNTSIRQFLSLKRYYGSKKRKKDVTTTDAYAVEKQDQELLLTQCIEVALYLPPPTNNEPTTTRRRTISFNTEPIKQPIATRQRKLSLPPQLNKNIGYLASIPEVDSQITLHNINDEN